MIRILFTLTLLLSFSTSFSQWTRVQQLPPSNFYNLYHKDSTLYASGENIVYISKNKGQKWDSTATIPQSFEIDNIIVYKNELYAASYSVGIFKSADDGVTWQNITNGAVPFVSDFCEFKGDLYAATFGNSVFKLNPVNRNSWLSFSSGLSSLSANVTSIAGNSNALIGGTLANGLYDYLAPNSVNWQERFLLGQIRPTEGTYDIITGHDTLFLAGHTGRYYMSTDNGLNWNNFGNVLPAQYVSFANARQALVSARAIFDGADFHTAFYYIKKDSLQNSFVNFSFVASHFTSKLEIFDNRLWDAGSGGLFTMPLSALPGITAADDSVNVVLPVVFSFVNASCEQDKVFVNWKTVQELNSNHFNIERSTDGITWTVIGNLPAAGNSTTEKNYSFTDNAPLQNGLYRIAEYDSDGRPQYSTATRSSCNVIDMFSIRPNPASDIVFVNIVTGKASQVVIKLFDSKGALVKTQQASLLQGSNQVNINVKNLASGIYQLSAEWNNGQMKKATQLLKQ